MHNWFAMETEAEFRRQEWVRAARNDKRATRLGSHDEPNLLQRMSVWTRQRMARRADETTPAAARGGRMTPQGAVS